MLTHRVQPSDIIPEEIAGEQWSWKGLAAMTTISGSFTISKRDTASFADPLDAYCDVLAPLSEWVVALRVRVDAPCLSLHLQDWKPQSRWHAVSLICCGRTINSVMLHFSDMPEHRYILPSGCIRNRMIEKIEDRGAPKVPFMFISASKCAQKEYEHLMEPQVMVRVALAEHVQKVLVDATVWKNFCQSANDDLMLYKWKRCYDERVTNDNGVPLAVYRAHGTLSRFRHLQSLIAVLSDRYGWVENDDWALQLAPIDRCAVTLLLKLQPTHVCAQNSLQWLPGATGRKTYLASVLCDMMLGFGVTNLLPPYVLLEIFDWHEWAERWTRFEKITIIERIHKQIRQIVARNISKVNKAD